MACLCYLKMHFQTAMNCTQMRTHPALSFPSKKQARDAPVATQGAIEHNTQQNSSARECGRHLEEKLICRVRDYTELG